MNITITEHYRLYRKTRELKNKFDKAAHMTELKRIIKMIRPAARYALDRWDIENTLALYEDGEFWAVAYIEQGLKHAPAFFMDIDDATHFFLWKLGGNGKSLFPPLDY